MLPVAVARSSSDNDAICCVFSVLWTTPCCHIMEGIGPNHYTTHMFRPVRQVGDTSRTPDDVVQSSAPGGGTGARSAVFDCSLFML